ncbi:S8 family serine peptidase [Kordia sp.]|uniref:S8 family serine peptidase n=1 Tax=Kordia sp. TaxID=1965332 RepID=UPI003B5D034E
MKSYKLLFLILSIYFVVACKSLYPIKVDKIPVPKSKISKQDWRNWQHKDIYIDSIPGISLDKAYKELLKDKKGDTIIVALLDNRIDSEHEDIKDFIWVNNNEIPNNNKDDDDNGFIDDVNGWNFLGNINGENVGRARFESTRIIEKYEKVFSDSNINAISKENNDNFKLYKKAKEAYAKSLDEVNYGFHYFDSLDQNKINLEKELSETFPNINLTIKNLEKVKKDHPTKADEITTYISYLKYPDWSESRRASLQAFLKIHLNLDYKEREVIGDNVEDLNDTNYGNGNITASTSSSHNHAIKVAGVLGANRQNNIGIRGISNNLKIMPVSVSPTGDEQDKDIALGIRYAVDNGAKIIIMTFTKFLVQHEDWLSDALKYAEKNDVLIVLSAGNSASNSDFKKTYPNDYNSKNIEYINNVIVVGGIRNSLDEKLVSEFSSYGKNNVDVFAPARSIYTTLRNNKYGYESGTSMSAPIVAGIAALIRCHYPNLTAPEVKQIIMKSGISLNIMVNKPSTSKEKELVPFSSLSKSGKIVNAYNALLMAEEVSKKKEKRK